MTEFKGPFKQPSEYLKEAIKWDEGYDLNKDIETIAEYAKMHDIKGKMHLDLIYSNTTLGIKTMDELPRRIAIYYIRLINTHRIKANVDEFIDIVLEYSEEKIAKMGILRVLEDVTRQLEGEEAGERFKKRRERLEKAPVPRILNYGDIYSIFYKFNDYIFQARMDAHFFENEPELKITGTVFETFKPDINPNKIKRIEDLPQKDVIRLLRVVNSFKRKDIVNKFLSDIGDFEDLYELFNLFVGYIFHEYENANYFLDEPELSTDPKYIPWQTTMFGRPVVIERA